MGVQIVTNYSNDSGYTYELGFGHYFFLIIIRIYASTENSEGIEKNKLQQQKIAMKRPVLFHR